MSSYNKTIRSAGYSFMGTLFNRKSCRQNKFDFAKFSLLCGGLHFLTQIFNFLVSTFRRSEPLMPRNFVAGTFWCCNILTLKNKKLYFLYKTRDSFSYEYFCRKFFFIRLTCIKNAVNTLDLSIVYGMSS